MGVVQGVVTELVHEGSNYGFFLQNTDATADGDPTSSDGIFVFQTGGSGSPLDPDVQVGNFVQVTGAVSEFRSSSTDPGTLTELTASAANISDAGDEFSPVQALTVPWPTAIGE